MKTFKKSIKMLLFGAVLLPVMTSCEKENDVVQTSDATVAADLQLQVNPAINNLTFPTNNGLLVFDSLDQLKETVKLLENEVIAYDDAFLERYGDLDEDALDQKEEEIGYDEYAPLRLFAQNNNLDALFIKQAAAEARWLAQPEWNPDTDPDNHFIEDEALQAVVNQQSEVMAGGAIYKMMDFGYVIITDGSFETLERIRQNPSFLEYENVEVVGDPDASRASGCRSSKGKSGYETSGSYRIKWKISHRTPITGRRVKCTTKNYFKKKNKWKKKRAYTLVKPYGNISGTGGRCDKAVDFNPNNLYSDRYNKKSWSWKVSVQTKTKSGWVKGYHYGIAGVSKYSTLTW